MPVVNPYAPPRQGPGPEGSSLPLTPLAGGLRRYVLEPQAFHAYVGRTSRAAFVRLLLLIFALGTILGMSGPAGRDTILLLGIPTLAGLPFWWLLLRAQTRRVEPKALEAYELIVGPRVLRRTQLGAPAAEILAPEVTSIFEIPDGLSIVSSRANGRLFVLRALGGYAEVRDHVAQWKPIVRRDGPGAWLRKRAHRSGEHTRDRVEGTSLEKDATLRDELRSVRAVARALDQNSIRRGRWLRRLIGLAWALVALMVLLWVFLTPAPKGATAPTPAATSKTPPD